MVKLTALQLCSVPDIQENLAQIDVLLAQLDESQNERPEHHLVVLPECCLFFGGKDKQQLAIAEYQGKGVMQEGLQILAKKYQVTLIAGTIPLLALEKNNQADKFTASSLLILPTGEIVSEYQKMHMFDVAVNDNTKSYWESQYTQPGEKLVCVETEFAKLGMSVCYDLRFPELFRSLRTQGAQVISVPAAFTYRTGKAHWQALLQARAIENQVYIIAANQDGVHANGRETWGHSMIINPWGEIVAQMTTGVGSVSAILDFSLLKQVRSDIPVAQHNRFDVGIKNK